MADVRKAFAYFWDFKEKTIERIEREARHPYAKIQDKVDAEKKIKLAKINKKGVQ